MSELKLRGKQLGDWRFKRRISGGGQGEVWLVEHVTTKHTGGCVAKVAKPKDDAALKRFEHEAAILHRMSHPRVVSLKAPIQSIDGYPFYVMEQARGTLQKPPAGAVVRLHRFREACEAASYAHSMGVIHRDIKPANILTTLQGAQLADFGIALSDLSEPNLTKTIEQMGSAGYSAPEVLQCEGADERSDVFSMTKVLQFLLTDQLPHASYYRASGALQLSDRAEKVFREVIQKGAAPTPADRYQTVDELLAALPELQVDLASPATGVLASDSAPDLWDEEKVKKHLPAHGDSFGIAKDLRTGKTVNVIWGSASYGFVLLAPATPIVRVTNTQIDRMLASDSLSFGERSAGGRERNKHGAASFEWMGIERDPMEVGELVQVNTDGTIVALNGYCVPGDGKVSLPSLERLVARNLSRFVGFATERLRASFPLHLEIGLTGIEGFQAIVDNPFSTSRFTCFQDTIHAGAEIDGENTDYFEALRPAFESLWDAFGLKRQAGA